MVIEGESETPKQAGARGAEGPGSVTRDRSDNRLKRWPFGGEPGKARPKGERGESDEIAGGRA